jgi:hypothetical protein
MTKKLFGVIAAVCLALCAGAHAQNWTTVSASNITDLNQQKLGAGNLCFLGTDQNDTPISFGIGGGGQALARPYCTQVANGVATSFTVPNPANTSPANICYRVTATDSSSGQTVLRYICVQFTGTTFNFDAYVPGFNLPLGISAPILSVGNLTITGTCTGCGSGGGGGGFYQTFQNAATSLTQRSTANFFSGITCADNSGASRTDCQVDQSFSPTWTGTQTFNGTTNIAGTFQISGAAPQGKIPIGNGSSYVPGDPLVQGTQAAGSTTATNPVSVGGYDTSGTPVLRTETVLNGSPAGTEYAFVTRNIPSGTQTVSVSGTAAISGTVTANIGTTNGLALDATVSNAQFTAGTTTAPGKVAVVGGKTSDSTPQYQPLPLTNGGAAVKIDGSAATQPVSGTFWQTTQPVSGTVTANAGTGNFNTIGTLADNGVAAATNRVGAVPGIYQTDYLNGTAATQGRDAALQVFTDGLLGVASLPAMRPASYVASATVASAASATDIAVLPGNASNTVLVTRVKVSCTQTAAGTITLNLIKRSTADSAGTSSNMTVVPDDSNYAAGVSAPKIYTANPTTGTAVGNVDTALTGCMASGTATPNDLYILNRQQKPIVLRGTAQQLAVNLNGATVSGGSFAVTFEYMEIKTITP